MNRKKKVGGASDQPGSGHQWTMGKQYGTQLLLVVAWIAVVCGPLALGWTAWQAYHPVRQATVATSPDAGQQAAQARAAEFGQRIILTWLTAKKGDEQALAAYLPQVNVTLPDTGLTVADPIVVDTVPAGDQIWMVTVAVTVSSPTATARRFFQLPVNVAGDTAAAVGLPAEIPATMLASAPKLAYPQTVAINSPIGKAAGEFLSALLAGQGDINRLITPGSHLVAVVPAPYEQISVASIDATDTIPDNPAAGDTAHIHVLCRAQLDTNWQQEMTYTLKMTVRDGRWEATAMEPPMTEAPTRTPALSPPQPVAQPSLPASPTVAPTGATTPQRKDNP